MVVGYRPISAIVDVTDCDLERPRQVLVVTCRILKSAISELFQTGVGRLEHEVRQAEAVHLADSSCNLVDQLFPVDGTGVARNHCIVMKDCLCYIHVSSYTSLPKILLVFC